MADSRATSVSKKKKKKKEEKKREEKKAEERNVKKEKGHQWKLKAKSFGVAFKSLGSPFTIQQLPFMRNHNSPFNVHVTSIRHSTLTTWENTVGHRRRIATGSPRDIRRFAKGPPKMGDIHLRM